MKKRVRLHETCVELEVPFHDVDPLNIVWHGHYYKYFELARTQLMRGLGLDAGEIIGGKYLLMVAESKCRYGFPLRYGERFEVSAWMRDIKNRLSVNYEIINLEHGRRSAHGHTILVTTTLEGQLLLETPRAILDAILG